MKPQSNSTTKGKINPIRITPYLSNISISHNCIPNLAPLAANKDFTNEIPSDVNHRLDEFTGKYTLLSIINSSISGVLFQKCGYEENAEHVILSDLLSEEEIGSIAESICKTVDRIPINYAFIIPLPDILYKLRSSDSDMLLFKNAKVIYKPNSLPENFQFMKGFSFGRRNLLGLGISESVNNRPIQSNKAYLVINSSGHCNSFGGASLKDDALQKVKAIFGGILALTNFHAYYPPGISYPETHAAVFDLGGKTKHQVYDFQLDADWARILNSGVWDFFENFYASKPNEARAIMQVSLERIMRIQTRNDLNPAIELACKWFVDSTLSTSNHMAYIQSMAAIEALLGDKDEANQIGLTNLLANRYAYLVGNTHAERKQQIKEFKQLYSLRSKIVHGAQNFITNKERDLLNRLRVICAKVISAEISRNTVINTELNQ